MTRNEALTEIRQAAARHGFNLEKHENGWIEITPLEGERYVNFTVFPVTIPEESDWEEGNIAVRYEVQASICRMGGEPTVKELYEAASQIGKAAGLQDEITKKNLIFYETRD